MLPPETQSLILARHFNEGHSIRRIAKDVGVSRKSVRAIVARRSVLLSRTTSVRPSILDPHKSKINAWLKNDPKLPASVILHKLRDEDGYIGGYTILREWVAGQRPLHGASKKEAFLTLSFERGECAQVDWGEFGDVFGEGYRIHCFVMVLCYSRLLYLEFTRSSKFEDFIRCHERAYRYFGGRTKENWYDNLASAVAERVGSLVRFNARFFAYAGHHGFTPYACNQARGNEKGRVEDGVKYIKSAFWPGRKFADFDDLCNQARDWMELKANRREHKATKRIPRLVFDAEEKPILLGLNPESYDTDEVFSKQVPPLFHITYRTNRYSVPWTLTGQIVTVRVSEREITFYYNDCEVSRHERSYKRNQVLTKPGHKEGLLDEKPKGKSSEIWRIDAVKGIGDAMEEYLACLNASQRSLRNELSKLLALATVYGSEAVNETVSSFLKRGFIGTDHIEMALKNSHRDEAKPAPLTFKDDHLSRVPRGVDLRRYDDLLINSQKSNNSKKEKQTHDREHET